MIPLLRPSLMAAVLLVFLFDFTSFGVILLLGGPAFATLEVQIYIQALQMLDLPLAALLSLIQLLCTIGFSILYTRMVSQRAVQTTPRAAEANLRRAVTPAQRLLVALMALLLTLFFVLPLVALPLRSVSRLDADRGQRVQVRAGFTTDYYAELFVNRKDSVFYVPPIRAASNSLALRLRYSGPFSAHGFPRRIGPRSAGAPGTHPGSDPDPASWRLGGDAGAGFHPGLWALAGLALDGAPGAHAGCSAVRDSHTSACPRVLAAAPSARGCFPRRITIQILAGG